MCVCVPSVTSLFPSEISDCKESEYSEQDRKISAGSTIHEDSPASKLNQPTRTKSDSVDSEYAKAKESVENSLRALSNDDGGNTGNTEASAEVSSPTEPKSQPIAESSREHASPLIGHINTDDAADGSSGASDDEHFNIVNKSSDGNNLELCNNLKRASSGSHISPQSVTSTPLLDKSKQASNSETPEAGDIFKTEEMMEAVSLTKEVVRKEAVESLQEPVSEVMPSGENTEELPSGEPVLKDDKVADSVQPKIPLIASPTSAPFPLEDRIKSYISACSTSFASNKEIDSSILTKSRSTDLTAEKDTVASASIEVKSSLDSFSQSRAKEPDIQLSAENKNVSNISMQREIMFSDLKAQLESLKVIV